MNRRKFLTSAAAFVAVAVARPAIPAGAYVAGQPAWLPAGWLLPQGQALVRSEFPKLFAALGTAYGSDGPLTFRLPHFGFLDAHMVQPIVTVIAGDDAAAYPAGMLLQIMKPEG